jgi:uncharacterized protein (DUF1501 family)
MKTLNASRREFLKVAAKLSLVGTAAPFALNLAAISAAAAQNAQDYRALVCVFLTGGNDHNNTIIPYDADNYAAYSRVRPAVARSRDDLLPIPSFAALSGSNAGREFALPPELAPLNAFWDSANLAVLANVGPLIVPTTRQQFFNASVPLPAKLFSHNDQQSLWQAYSPEDTQYGWGGRLGDLFAATNGNSAFTCNSLAGNSLFLAGQSASAYRLNNRPTTIAGIKGSLFGSTLASNTLKTLITRGGEHVLAQDLAATTERSIDAGLALSVALTNVADFPLSAELADNPLATQLRMVARVIAARKVLGVKRQVFFVALNGFDSHDDQLTRQPLLHAQLANALHFFYSSLATLEVSEQVTTFTASDFGRTLVNNSDGTDHGWGAHHLILGGAVKGQQFYGTFPMMGVNNNDEVGSGRLLPSTSVDQYAATLARWFGVSDRDMSLVLPNIGNFNNADLGFMQG